ncbi:MAG: hypothetical protein WDN44_08390 [Sphingomonas sp.]
MRTLATVAALALAVAAPGLRAQEAAPISVAEFLVLWGKVQSQKPISPTAPDTIQLAHLFGDTAKAYKEQLEADERAGRPPRACPIKGSTDTMTMDEIADALDAIPEAFRGQPFRDAMFDFLDKRYPCPATPASPAG